MISVARDRRAGCSVKTKFAECRKILCVGHAFGDDRKSDAVGDGREPFEEGGVADVVGHPAYEAGVDLEEVEAKVMQLAYLAEVMAEMF